MRPKSLKRGSISSYIGTHETDKVYPRLYNDWNLLEYLLEQLFSYTIGIANLRVIKIQKEFIKSYNCREHRFAVRLVLMQIKWCANHVGCFTAIHSIARNLQVLNTHRVLCK